MGCSTSAPLSLPSGPVSVESAAADPTTGSGPIRRHPTVAEGELVRSAFPGEFTTLYDGFQRGLRLSGDDPCMGYRPITAGGDGGKSVAGDFVWKTYKECAEMRDAIGSAMHHENLFPVREDPEDHLHLSLRMTALFSKNRWEWVIVEQACNAYGGVSVALYDTLGAEAVAFVIQQTGIQTVWAAKEELKVLLAAREASPEAMASVTTVVTFEDVEDADRTKCAAVGITLRSFNDLLKIGRANLIPHQPPKPDDVATFCYTSGTTGNPKGAMLTHGNIVADSSGGIIAGLAIEQTDVHLSYLPLAHMFERIVQVSLFVHGARIGFYQGSPLKLMEDIGALQPTIFPSVPRLFNKIYDKITAGVNAQGGIKAKLFHKALATKKKNLQNNILTSKLWDGKVFGPVKARLGFGNVRLVVTGSAPIASHVMEFLKCLFACPIIEGYGQTECAAACSLTIPNDVASSGHVGVPLPCNEIKLMSVEDMGYRWDDQWHGRVVDADGTMSSKGIPCLGRGEICYRGPNIFVGYFKSPDKTAEALTADGWLKSGDIGIWTTEGFLKVVDRKKNIFKLSQGEYVAPEKCENVYGESAFIAQSFVYGDSLQSVLVGVIVPDVDHLTTWCPANNIPGTTMEEWVRSPELKKAILADINTIGRAAKLKGFEIVKDIHLHAEPFSVDNGILTPTFKLKRNDAKRVFQAQIDAMYSGKIGVIGGVAGLKQGEVESKVAEEVVPAVASAVSATASSAAKSAESSVVSAARSAGASVGGSAGEKAAGNAATAAVSAAESRI